MRLIVIHIYIYAKEIDVEDVGDAKVQEWGKTLSKWLRGHTFEHLLKISNVLYSQIILN